MPSQARLLLTVSITLVIFLVGLQSSGWGNVHAEPAALTHQTFLPLLRVSGSQATPTPTPTPSPSPTPISGSLVRRVNAPNFQNSAVDYASTAVFWFGQVNPLTGYADARVGYNNQELLVSLNVIDRRLWYNTDPLTGPLGDWDSATLYLNLDGNTGAVPGANAYRFDAQLNWWEARTNYQAAYRGNNSSWSASSAAFTTTSIWRGNAPNDDTDDEGWQLTYEIPFTSLGLSGPPAKGTTWGFSVVLHNRDYLQYAPMPDESWPETLAANQPSTWGQLVFGLPQYSPPGATSQTTTTIRQGLNGAVVPDAGVGGTLDNLCGGAHGGWSDWGNTGYANAPRLTIQNQSDIADWRCFGKYYISFPLDAIPPGKAIVSAKLTLHEFGNAGAPGQALPSLIQVMTVADDWSAPLTWNNAPLAYENVSRAWVDPIITFPGWPGVPWQWDVSRAAAQAYASGKPLRLVLYEADSAYHSGKYFTGSNEPDWNSAARPTLEVIWGNP